MTTVQPLPDQSPADHDQPVTSARKSVSVKRFLLASCAKLGIGVGVFGGVMIVAWLAREQLATTSFSAFLRSKGIPAGVTIENLQLDTAQIRDLRLGPVDKPSLVAKSVIIKWRVDSKARLFIVEGLTIDGVTLRVGVTAEGKLDFGALGPLMEPSRGPKRSVISNVAVSNALLVVETPQGQGSARLKVWGGEREGWTGRADITPPATMIARGRANNVAFEPIRVGFAYKQIPPTGQNTKAISLIGFSVRPNGQSLRLQGYDATGLTGNVTGQLMFQEGGSLRLDTRSVSLSVQRLVGQGLDVSRLNLESSPIFWTQSGVWQTTGWGNLVAIGTVDRLNLEAAKQTSGATRFRIGAARAQSGRMQLDYQIDASNLSGPLTGRRLAVTGSGTTTLRDLTKFDKAVVSGKGQVFANSLVLPSNLRAALPATAPTSFLNALNGTFSGTGSFDFRVTPESSQISLSGPLALTGSTGLRASWIPKGGGAPSLIFKTQLDDTIVTTGLAAGQLNFDVPALGRLTGEIDGASFGPNGWALIGRDLNVTSQTLLPNIFADVTFDRFDVRAPRTGLLTGRGGGKALIYAPQAGRAALEFDLNATPSTILGSVQGPIDGFGASLGLGGYGIRSGVLILKGQANRLSQSWQFDGRGQVRANALATTAISVIAPDLTMIGNGQITDQGQLAARAKLSGRAVNAMASPARGALGLGGIAIDSKATIGGTLAAVNLTGNLITKIDRGNFSNISLSTAQSDIQFSGLISASQARVLGTHTTNFGRFARTSGPQNGRIDVAGAAASGPFTFQTGRQGLSTPFWDGQLAAVTNTLTTNLTFSADSVRAGSTSLAALRLTAPITFSSRGAAWRTSADVDLVAQRLVSGDTRLNGLVATGPIVVANDRVGQMRFSSSRCLGFRARSGSFPGEASVGALSGKLCPDRAGQLAVITDASPRLFATTQIDPLNVQIGGPNGDQSLEIGEVNGTLVTNRDGRIGLNMLASQFGFNLKMPDGTTATIKANEAALNVIPQSGGIGLQGRIGRVSSIGLPVLLSGGATADLIADARGLGGTFNFDEIIVKDIEKSPRFGEMAMAGSGTLTGNQVAIVADVREPASTIKMATITLSHDIRTGAGSLDVNAKDLLMSPTPLRGRPGLDIVALVPPLRGVVSDMIGVANASANFAWARGAPIVSRANIETKGLDFATMLGPITAFAGDINLNDVLLVRTPGTQTISIGLFDPGLPIADGTVQFSLAGDNSLKLENASWPFAEGKLSVRPATWAFRDGDQTFAIDVDDVDLAKLLRLTEVPNLEIDGKVSGVFPIEVRDGNVEIVGGRLRAREGGGVIRYTGPNASPPPPPPGFFGRVRQRLFGKPAPVGADLAVEALRALEYKILEITVDGRITGELQMGVILEGANQQVLSGQPFKFNVKMNVPVGQLLDNLDRLNNAGSSPEVLKEIDRVMREDAATATPTNPPTIAPPPRAP